MKIALVGGARPNFIKIAPLWKEMKKNKYGFNPVLIHTGQHYDYKLSEIFFRDLNLPKPDFYLGIGSASHAKQTAKIMLVFEKVMLKIRPNLIMVVGDVNSTLACSLVGAKLNIKVAHVEAGLRSFDRSMPEEVNRVVTDALSSYLFVSEENGLKNLKNEGVDSRKVFFVGNVMIDTLLSRMPLFDKSKILEKLNLSKKQYCVLTLHRPSNVDSLSSLSEIYKNLANISKKIRVVYPIHPRSKKMIKTYNFLNKFQKLQNLLMIEPLGYIDFIKLVKESRFVLTDSGGIQEETTVLKIPCLTMRDNTERPVTIKEGTNYLVGRDKRKINKYIEEILKDWIKRSKIPRFWDGKTAERIAKILKVKL